MIHTIQSEWIKVRTVTMNWVLGGVTVALPLLVSVLTALFTSDDPGHYDTRTLVEDLVGSSIFTGLIHGIIATAGVTGEFGFGTIRPTFAATPSRLRVVAAKVVVAVLTACSLTTVVLLVSYFASAAVADGNGVKVDLAEMADGSAPLVGAVVFAGLMAVVGVGLGLLVRSTPGAVTILLAWPLVVEGLVGGLVQVMTSSEKVMRRFTFQCGFRLMSLSSEFDFDFMDEPSRLASGVVFALFAVVVLALGTLRTQRSDA